MRGEKRARSRAAVPVDVFGDGPGDGKPVVGGGPAADFVEDDEAFRRGVVENVGGLVHFDHEGRVPARELVGRADAAENPVGDADARRLRRHPAADLRQQRDERDLANVGGFARHVRPGDDVDLRSRSRKVRAVGHESLHHARAAQHLFDDGMPPFLDLKRVGVVHLRLAVIPFLRNLRPAREHVELRESSRRFRQRRRIRERLFDDFAVELRFAPLHELVRVKDFVFLAPQLRRRVALRADERLPPRPSRGNFGQIGLRDFDVVAERSRVAHAQTADVRLVLKAFFEIEKPRLAVRAQVAQRVETRVEPAANRAVHVDGKLVGERGTQQLQKLFVRVDARADRVQRRRRSERGGAPDFRDARERFPNRAEFPRLAQAVLQARQRARDVLDAGERLADARRDAPVGEKRLHAVLPFPHGGGRAQRRSEPALEQARSRGGARAVDRAQQRTVARSRRGAEKLQVARARRIDDQRIAAAHLRNFPNMPGRFAKRFRDVVEQRSRGTECRIFFGNAEAVEAVDFEHAANRGLALPRVEMPVRQPRNEIALQQNVEIRRRPPLLPGFGNENFARPQRLQRSEQRGALLRRGDAELRRRNVDPCRVKPAAVVVQRENVIVAFGVELRVVERRSRRDDADERAPDKLSRLGRFRLLADGDFHAGVQRFLQIRLQCVVRHAGERRSRAPRQRQPEQLRPALRVRAEHFVKVAHAEKQQRVRRKLVPELPVLLDHRRLVEIGGHGFPVILRRMRFRVKRKRRVPAARRERGGVSARPPRFRGKPNPASSRRSACSCAGSARKPLP